MPSRKVLQKQCFMKCPECKTAPVKFEGETCLRCKREAAIHNTVPNIPNKCSAPSQTRVETRLAKSKSLLMASGYGSTLREPVTAAAPPEASPTGLVVGGTALTAGSRSLKWKAENRERYNASQRELMRKRRADKRSIA